MEQPREGQRQDMGRCRFAFLRPGQLIKTLFQFKKEVGSLGIGFNICKALDSIPRVSKAMNNEMKFLEIHSSMLRNSH